ncbi:MAG: hypothetical protein COB36_10600 [Alphaproteobacteria bacterium]|nr:MAG: hypothetical protein COB36_10600 [Alphaproteobacteria bacterium]
MDVPTWSLVISILAGAAGIIWHASRVKANVDTHGNAIGELKTKQDAQERAINNHHGRISTLEGHRK